MAKIIKFPKNYSSPEIRRLLGISQDFDDLILKLVYQDIDPREIIAVMSNRLGELIKTQKDSIERDKYYKKSLNILKKKLEG
jgi:hypothetical protein